MPITITLQDNLIPLWESFIAEREKELEIELEAIRRLKNQTAEDPFQSINTNLEKYSPEWSTLKKIQFIIGEQGKIMTSGDIVHEIIAKYEPEKAESRRQLMSGISSVLSLNNGAGKPLFKSTTALNENAFGLSGWLEK